MSDIHFLPIPILFLYMTENEWEISFILIIDRYNMFSVFINEQDLMRFSGKASSS